MFLSILIPCRDYDCTDLVCQLYIQSLSIDCDIEILIGDDKSSKKIIDICKIKKEVETLGGHFVDSRIRVLSTMSISGLPMGAGKMRNYLATKSYGTYLLFLDSDVVLSNRHFLKTYIDIVDNCKNSVVVGGFCYDDKLPSRDFQLKYYYGHNVEFKSIHYRKRNPYQSFISMNFVVPKQIYADNPMSSVVSMGYEDTLWGKMLEDRCIDIIHIDNNVVHTIKETNEEFLKKTYSYVDSLKLNKDCFPKGTVKLLDLYRNLKFLSPIFRFLSIAISKHLEGYLFCNPQKLKVFQLLKFLRLCN